MDMGQTQLPVQEVQLKIKNDLNLEILLQARVVNGPTSSGPNPTI